MNVKFEDTAARDNIIELRDIGQSYDGGKTFVQPLLYDEVAMNSKAKWDYKNNEPAVVVIELGANDFANHWTVPGS